MPIEGEKIDVPSNGDEAAGLGPVGVDGDMEDEELLESRYPTRARRAPGEWYRANVAVETGEHPRDRGSIRSPKPIRKP